jgi:hypothetical protein
MDQLSGNRVNLSQLIKAAGAVGLLHDRILPMTAAARDFRDTVHPNREVRLGSRASQPEAKLFLALVPLIHRDLAAYAARSRSTAQLESVEEEKPTN